MMAGTNIRGRAWGPIIQVGIAAGLLIALSGCAEPYRAACTAAGYQSGSAEFDACFEDQVAKARAERTRHHKYGQGGAGS